eukprot:Seg3589.2 transcript_id=Seg3589.2/GoldUCD/mRNA.D3Y31 product="hypothetical protein" protein_id=Seg3589.2/GoldUCD/D3Y31
MSFSQNTNSFLLSGVIYNQATKLGTSGYDFTFISEDEQETGQITRADYTIPPHTQWKIALNKITYINEKRCFTFPTAAAARTAEFNFTYDLYEIEIAFGPMRYFPLALTHFPDGVPEDFVAIDAFLLEIEQFAKPFTPDSPKHPPYIEYNYLKSAIMAHLTDVYYEKYYNNPPLNKAENPNPHPFLYDVPPVVRVNLLELIPDFGHTVDINTGTYKLSSAEFIHILNNLLDTDGLSRVKNAGNMGCFNVPLTLPYSSTWPTGTLFGRSSAFTGTTKEQFPVFNITASHRAAQGGRYVEMTIKIPLSVKYIAFGSILRNICGFQKICNTPPIMKEAALERHSLDIIYNADANSYYAPAKITKFSSKDPQHKDPDNNAIIATPYYPTGDDYYASGKNQHDYRLWSFPKIPRIDGSERNFTALLTTEAGNSAYDFITIKSQYPLNPLNSGDIFMYSQSKITTDTHIGNFLSQILAHVPSPVFGFGYANLEDDPTTIVDSDSGELFLEHIPVQKEFYPLTSGLLNNFNVNPRNAFRDKVILPFVKMEFLIKRFK